MFWSNTKKLSCTTIGNCLGIFTRLIQHERVWMKNLLHLINNSFQREIKQVSKVFKARKKVLIQTFWYNQFPKFIWRNHLHYTNIWIRNLGKPNINLKKPRSSTNLHKLLSHSHEFHPNFTKGPNPLVYCTKANDGHGCHQSVLDDSRCILLRQILCVNYCLHIETVIEWILIEVWDDYIIFLTTLYDIIFWWWSYTHNSDQNLC